jgi:hypothetical protein
LVILIPLEPAVCLDLVSYQIKKAGITYPYFHVSYLDSLTQTSAVPECLTDKFDQISHCRRQKWNDKVCFGCCKSLPEESSARICRNSM